jgi:nucleoid-associated protein YgaU
MEAIVPSFPPRAIRQPQAFDIVDDPIKVSGVGTGFEATFAARVRDADGTELTQVTIMAGGTGIWANFHELIALPSVPSTPQGTLEVFEFSAKDGSEVGKVTIPITFGTYLIPGYVGFGQVTIAPGDTLSALAQSWYGDASKWPIIFEANRDQIVNPNLIFPGQILRIPQ